MKITNEMKKAIEGLKSIKGDNKIAFEAKNGEMSISASSRSCFGVYTTKTNEELSLMVNFDHLLRILSVTKEPELSLKDNMAYFTEGDSELSLPIVSALVNKFQGEGTPVTLKLKEEDFESFSNHTAFAVSKDESRPVFTGVGIKTKDGEVYAYASNMHKLAHIKISADISGNLDVIKILPKEVFSLKPEGDVTMVIYNNLVSVSYGGFEFFFRLIEGSAPNYDAVIPTTNVEMVVSKEEFLGEIQKALLVSVGKDMNPIQIYFRSDKIEVYSECHEFGKVHGAMRATIPAILQNKRIAFNGEYLGELKHFNADTFTLATVVNGDSIELSPVKFHNEEEEYTFVVTPVRMKAWTLDEK